MQSLIEKAWSRFVKLDTLSIESQQKTRKWERAILLILVVTPILEFIYNSFAGKAGGNTTDFSIWFPAVTVFILSTIAILSGLKTFIWENKLFKERRADYVLARSLAEELKSTIYLFCLKAAEYRTLQGKALKLLFIHKVKAIVKKGDKLNRRYPNTKKRTYLHIPKENMSIEDYKTQRLNDQIKFYKTKSEEFEQKEKRNRRWMFVFGILAIILSSISSVVIPLKLNESPGFLFVSFFSSIIAALLLGFEQVDQWRTYKKMKNAYLSTANVLDFVEDEFGDTLELVEESEKAMRDDHIAWATLMNSETFLPEKSQSKTAIDFTDLESELVN